MLSNTTLIYIQTKLLYQLVKIYGGSEQEWLDHLDLSIAEHGLNETLKAHELLIKK